VKVPPSVVGQSLLVVLVSICVVRREEKRREEKRREEKRREEKRREEKRRMVKKWGKEWKREDMVQLRAWKKYGRRDEEWKEKAWKEKEWKEKEWKEKEWKEKEWKEKEWKEKEWDNEIELNNKYHKRRKDPIKKRHKLVGERRDVL
jgi:hypothetical protein